LYTIHTGKTGMLAETIVPIHYSQTAALLFNTESLKCSLKLINWLRSRQCDLLLVALSRNDEERHTTNIVALDACRACTERRSKVPRKAASLSTHSIASCKHDTNIQASYMFDSTAVSSRNQLAHLLKIS
jgi:hypothetical protein